MTDHITDPNIAHWTGPAGDKYAQRQTLTIEARRVMFDRALQADWRSINAIIEFGASTGDNLRALRIVCPEATLVGVEPNAAAMAALSGAANIAIESTIQEFSAPPEWPGYDLAFTRGVLIHIPPADLLRAYQALYINSRRLILIAEYYSPAPREILYRGKPGLLWARDFAGEMMTAYPDLKLLDYGFVYHRDPVAPQDDVTWFLLEKS